MSNTTCVFKKTDIRNCIIIGVMVAVFFIFISKSIGNEAPVLGSLLKFKWLILILVPAALSSLVYGAYLCGKCRPIFFQVGKFMSIGLANGAVDFGTLNLLMFLTDRDSGWIYSCFKAISFLAALVNSYMWNKFWTFESRQTKGMGFQFFQFALISVIAFSINVGVASLVVNFVEPIGNISPRIWANIGAMAAVGFTGVWNFCGYKFIVFKKTPDEMVNRGDRG